MVRAKMMVLGDASLVNGFRLTGIEDFLITSSEKFQDDLEAMMAKPEYGIIIVNEGMLTSVDWRMKKKLDTIAYPVIVPMPDASGKSSGGDEIRQLIKRALGFDLGANK